MFNFDDFEMTPAHIIKTIVSLAIIGVLSFLVARYAKRRVVTGQYTALPATAAPAIRVEPMKEEEEVDAMPTTVEVAAADQPVAPVSAPSFGSIRIA